MPDLSYEHTPRPPSAASRCSRTRPGSSRPQAWPLTPEQRGAAGADRRRLPRVSPGAGDALSALGRREKSPAQQTAARARGSPIISIAASRPELIAHARDPKNRGAFPDGAAARSAADRRRFRADRARLRARRHRADGISEPALWRRRRDAGDHRRSATR